MDMKDDEEMKERRYGTHREKPEGIKMLSK